MTPVRTGSLGIAIATALFALTGTAHADEAIAEAMFEEGRALMAEGKHAEACEKFKASDEAAPSVGARINLGDCSAAQGKTATAWGHYKSAANLARRQKDERRARLASAKADDLEPTLTYAQLDVPTASRVDGLVVAWDGEQHAPALWGQRFPVDPGSHEVSATADGHHTWSDRVEAGAPGETVAVAVPVLEQLPDIARGGDGHDPRADAPSRFTTGRRVALGLATGGVIALGVGTAFGLSARSKWNDATDNHCNAQLQCDSDGQKLATDASRAGNIATIGFAAGIVAVGGAVALWFISKPDAARSAERDVSIHPIVDTDRVAVGVRGRF